MSATTTNELLPAPVRAALPYLLLVLAVFAAYGNIYDNAFLFDDDLLITLNTHLSSWHFLPQILTGSTTSGAHIAGGFFRPVQMLLYFLVTQLMGGGLFWFHFLNLVLHIANTCLMFRVGTKLKFNLWGVFLTALIWGVHSLHTEAVTYISATADPLFTFFALLSISLLLPDITARKIWLIFPLFLLGLLSKETMAMFPLLIMVCLFYTNEKRFLPHLYIRTLPLWVVSLVYIVWRSHAVGFDGPQTYDRYYALPTYANLKLYAAHPLYRLYTFFATLPPYLNLILAPHDLHMERHFDVYTDFLAPSVIAGFVIICLAIGFIIHAFYCHKKGAPLAWGILWFFAAHAPDTGILIPMNSLFLEHWMYLPTVGLFLGAGEYIAQSLKKKEPVLIYAISAAGFLFAGFLATTTYAQNQVWKNPETFYTHIFSYGEVSARSRNNLALYYSNLGQYGKAAEQYEQAVKISDTYAETRYNMAINYLNMPAHQTQAAIDCLNRSLQIDPNFYRSYKLLGDVYQTILHDQTKAEANHARAAALMPKQ